LSPKNLSKNDKICKEKKLTCSKESALRWVGPIYHSIEYELLPLFIKKKRLLEEVDDTNPPSRLGVSCEFSFDCELGCEALLVQLHKTLFSCLASQGDALLSYDQGPRKMASPFTFPLAFTLNKRNTCSTGIQFFKMPCNFFCVFSYVGIM
jgi:hypothetical protein